MRRTGSRPRPASAETGSGTVSVLGTAALGAGLLLAVTALGQASVAGTQAAGAADLAALAASDARRGLSGHASAGLEPCALAGETAGRNGAAVVECEVREDGTVRVAVERGRAPLPPATAEAVAGPPRLQAPAPEPEDPPPESSAPSAGPAPDPPADPPAGPSASTGTR